MANSRNRRRLGDPLRPNPRPPQSTPSQSSNQRPSWRRKLRPKINWNLPKDRERRARQEHQPKTPRFRRVKVVRPCVIRLVFFVPLIILLVERYIGFLISLDDLHEVYQQQLGLDPLLFPPPLPHRTAPTPDLANITYTQPSACPKGLRRMVVVNNLVRPLGNRIPHIVHQTAKSRCLTTSVSQASVAWAFRGWSYILHDEDAVQRLLETFFPEFPRLALVQDCLSPTLRQGLWQYLALWVWGGLYTDLNSYPHIFNATTIRQDDDGLVLLEESQQGITTATLALSPKHPLMYYAVQHAISNLLQLHPGQLYNARQVVGEGALQQAWTDFVGHHHRHGLRRKNDEDRLPVANEVVTGAHGRQLRVAGGSWGTAENALVQPIFEQQRGWAGELVKLNMSEYTESVEGPEGCWRPLLVSATAYGSTKGLG